VRLRGDLSRGEGLTLAALVLVAVALFAMPLVLLFAQGLVGADGPSVRPLAEALGSRAVRTALVNSLDSSAVSAVLALVLGTLLALVLALTDVRGRAVVVFCILLPMMVPPHVTAIAWTQSLGPSSPVLGALGLAPPPGSANPLYSREGVIALLALQHAPLVFLVLYTALRTLPREVVEAARVAGAGPGRTLARVILPLMTPALLAAFALAYVSALGNFGIPALLGTPGRYTTLPVLIWQRLSSFGPGMLPAVAVLSALMAAVALVAVMLQLGLAARARTRLTGPPQPPLRLALGPWRRAAEAALALLVGATLVLPLVSLVGTSLVPTFGVPIGWDTITPANYAEVLLRQRATLRAFANSTFAAGAAASALAALAVLAGYFLTARGTLRRRGGQVFATLAELASAVPGIILSVAFILMFLRPLPVLGLSIYNTLAIIVLAYLAAFAAIALKPVIAACLQLDPALDEAARVSGAGFGRRMGRVFGPLAAPAAASGAILVFLTAYNEVTVSALLWSTGNETIGTTIFSLESAGDTTAAAAMSVVTVVATAALMLTLDRSGRRLPPGVIPWRL
jgi:iron(III) transport system permease protein